MEMRMAMRAVAHFTRPAVPHRLASEEACRRRGEGAGGTETGSPWTMRCMSGPQHEVTEPAAQWQGTGGGE